MILNIQEGSGGSGIHWSDRKKNGKKTKRAWRARISASISLIYNLLGIIRLNWPKAALSLIEGSPFSPPRDFFLQV